MVTLPQIFPILCKVPLNFRWQDIKPNQVRDRHYKNKGISEVKDSAELNWGSNHDEEAENKAKDEFFALAFAKNVGPPFSAVIGPS